MTPESVKTTHETLKQRLMDALRKTGHVSEAALETVATIAIETTTGLGSEG